MLCTQLGETFWRAIPTMGTSDAFLKVEDPGRIEAELGLSPNPIPFLCLVFSACLSELL